MLIYKRVERVAGAGDTILDIGAKGGSNITETEATIIAIDLEFSRSLTDSEIEYCYGDGRELPFKDNAFEYVVLNQVLEHVNGRAPLVAEVRRVLKPGGTALFSFPNRFTPNTPHGLPRFTSMLPKPLGVPIGRLFLDDTQCEYYREGLFPLSPVGARTLLRQHFDTVRYITLEESVQSTEIYGDRLAPRLFVASLPLLTALTKSAPLRWLFELVWGYASYECKTRCVESV